MPAYMWEVVGWIASGIVVISMLQQRITRLRLINMVGCIVSAIYAGAVGAWPVVGLNGVLTAIQAWNLWRLWGSRHDERTYSVLEVSPSGALITHMLSHHGEDVRAFTPGFKSPTDSDGAFVIMSKDQLVGLVLVSFDGETARIDVDYVTPPYRDFTPGEFLFRQSGVWKQRGISSVRAACGGPDYYASVGFEQQDGEWVLELAAV